MLEIEQIFDAKNREDSRGKYLMSMVQHQERVKMHCDTKIAPNAGSYPMSEFRKMVESLLPSYKVDMFFHLLRYPLPTVALTSTVFDRLSRVFEGRNPVYNYQFGKTEYADNWEWYRQEVLDEPNVWKTKAWDYFRTEPNSVLVVDMPVQKLANGDKYLQPYFYWVTVENIIDYAVDETGAIKWIMYRNDERKRVYVVDDMYYRSFPYKGDRAMYGSGGDGVDFTMEGMTENRHNLGYCPATFFIDQPVSLSMPDVKKSPITDVLGDLDWYLFYATSERHLDLYGSYPIYSAYEDACDYEIEVDIDGVKGIQKCDHGKLVDGNGNPVIDATTGLQAVCPKCHGGNHTRGAGTLITVPMPESEQGIPDMIDAVKIIGVDRDSLDFNAEKVKSLGNDIINKCVGTEGDVFTEFSISEKQVDANYESQSTILVRVKKIFENAQWFVDNTICRLRYGSNFVSCQINYGTEFYTLTTDKLRELYKNAKDGGANQADLLALRKQIIETEYRTDPLMMQRMLILADVEPLLGSSATEAVTLLEKGLASEDDVKVKVNFDSLIKRFERENTNIIDFGASEPYRTKIEKITQTLYDYVRAIKPRDNNSEAVRSGAGESN